jgi:hypothetical protein
MTCANCGLAIDEWMGGYVHAVNGAKVCPGLKGVAKPASVPPSPG